MIIGGTDFLFVFFAVLSCRTALLMDVCKNNLNATLIILLHIFVFRTHLDRPSVDCTKMVIPKKQTHNTQDNIDYSLPFDCLWLLEVMLVLQLEALCVCACACDSADCLEY